MKLKKLFFMAFVLISPFATAQEVSIEGIWKGELKVMAQKLPLIFHFEPIEDGWKGSMDSPAQGAKDIPLSKMVYHAPKMELEIDQYTISYEGELINDTIQGTFIQGGVEFPLNLVRMKENEEAFAPKPQEPRPPFDYDIIETSFTNLKAGITLKGTITKPKGMGPFPAVVLVSGSGKQNKNAEIFGHKPFWVIADYLTRNGIVVLRYDERGAGHSGGVFETATSFDFKNDATVALQHLKKYPFVNQLKSGVIGHSEGGMIAWMMAAEEKGVGFIISLAGPVVPIPELMMQQTQDVLKSSGASAELIEEQGNINKIIYEVFKETDDYRQLKKNLSTAVENYWRDQHETDSVNEVELQHLEKAYGQMVTPWFYSFLKFDPKPYILQTSIPALAVFGGKDVQVNGEINYAALEALKKVNIDMKLYPMLNHLFQKAESGAISEYANLQETFNEEVMKDLVAWIESL